MEIGGSTPRLDYVRGMLETLLAMMPKEVSTAELKAVLNPPVPQTIGGQAYIDELKRLSGGMS